MTSQWRNWAGTVAAVGGRPHWGKMHTRDAGYLSEVYPRFGDFVALRDKLDPDRRFGQYLPPAGPRLVRGVAESLSALSDSA